MASTRKKMTGMIPSGMSTTITNGRFPVTTGKLMVDGFPFKFPGGETQVRINTKEAVGFNPANQVTTFAKRVRSGEE